MNFLHQNYLVMQNRHHISLENLSDLSPKNSLPKRNYKIIPQYP